MEISNMVGGITKIARTSKDHIRYTINKLSDIRDTPRRGREWIEQLETACDRMSSIMRWEDEPRLIRIINLSAIVRGPTLRRVRDALKNVDVEAGAMENWLKNEIEQRGRFIIWRHLRLNARAKLRHLCETVNVNSEAIIAGLDIIDDNAPPVNAAQERRRTRSHRHRSIHDTDDSEPATEDEHRPRYIQPLGRTVNPRAQPSQPPQPPQARQPPPPPQLHFPYPHAHIHADRGSRPQSSTATTLVASPTPSIVGPNHHVNPAQQFDVPAAALVDEPAPAQAPEQAWMYGQPYPAVLHIGNEFLPVLQEIAGAFKYIGAVLEKSNGGATGDHGKAVVPKNDASAPGNPRNAVVQKNNGGPTGNPGDAGGQENNNSGARPQMARRRNDNLYFYRRPDEYFLKKHQKLPNLMSYIYGPAW